MLNKSRNYQTLITKNLEKLSLASNIVKSEHRWATGASSKGRHQHQRDQGLVDLRVDAAVPAGKSASLRRSQEELEMKNSIH